MKPSCILATAFLGLMLTGPSALAQEPRAAPVYSNDIEAKIARIVSDIASPVVAQGAGRPKVTLAERMAALKVAGVSVAVINDGKIEWARGFGVTRIGGPPVTPETLFQAGSISKPVAAMGALKLVEQGKLDLDADVNRYLRSWKVPENDFTQQNKVTLRRLLTHTAGLTVHGFPGYASGTPVPTVPGVLDGTAPANTAAVRVDVIPGTLWRYSGGGYTVAQLMMSDVAQKPFADLMRESVLVPLGMRNSTYEQPLPASRMANAATPYDRTLAPIEGGAHTYPEMAAAGLWTTPTDLARYALEVQASLAGRSNRVLSKAMTVEMLRPSPLREQGLGPAVGGSSGQRYFAHGGVDAGFVSQLTVYENGDGAVIMTNGDNGGQIAQELMRTIALEYGWNDFKPVVRKAVAVDAAAMDGLVGHYQSGRFTTTEITRVAEELYAKPTGQSQKLRLFASDARTWFLTEANVTYVFDVDTAGRAQRFISRNPAYDTNLPRIEASQAAAVASELAAKIRDRTPDPRAEATLRRNIDELARGTPDYAQMMPGIANTTRQQMATLKTMMTTFGPPKFITHRRVGPNGADIFFVAFEREPTEWRILLTSDGKIESVGVGPPQTPANEAERTAAFRAQDADGDGRLDKSAFKAALDSLGLGGELDRLYMQRDVNGDGRISREEFAQPAQ